MLEGYGRKCVDGCVSCARSSGAASEPLTVACNDDGIIVDVLDAAYGAAVEQPPWKFSNEPVRRCRLNTSS